MASSDFFQNLFNAPSSAASVPAPNVAESAASVAPPSPAVLQGLVVPSSGSDVTFAVALGSQTLDAKSLEAEGLTYAQVAERVREGSSADIGSYSVIDSTGNRHTVNGNDKFVAEFAGTPVTRVETTPARSGTLG